MAAGAKDDVSSEAKHFDQYYNTVRGKDDYLEVSQEWLRRAVHPHKIPLDYWEYVFFLLGDLSGQTVLDLGCGSGWITRLLALKGASVTAMDVSLEGCRVTRERLKACGSRWSSIAVADAHRLPFKGEVFDVVLSTGVLHHVNIKTAATEIQRVLKPGGRVVGYEPLKWGPVMSAVRRTWLNLKGQKEDEHTDNEAPLEKSDFAPFQDLFPKVLIREMNLVAKTNRLERRFGLLANSLRWADFALLSAFPFLRRHCTTIDFRFEK